MTTSHMLTDDKVTRRLRDIEHRVMRGDLWGARFALDTLFMRADTQDFSLYGWTKRVAAINRRLKGSTNE
jgi:hypothetical protein